MVFADGGVHTLTEIAGAAHLPTSTAHRLASELVARRLLERTEERSYRIGLPLRMIGNASSDSDVCSYTQTVLRALPVLDACHGPPATRCDWAFCVVQMSSHSRCLPTGSPKACTLMKRSSTVSYPRTRQPRAKHCSPLPTRGGQPCHRGRVARAFTRHTITSPDVLRQTLAVDQVDADRDSAQRIRVRQSGDRHADLLRRGPRRGRHRTHRPRSGQRIETGRRRAVRCVSPVCPANSPPSFA